MDLATIFLRQFLSVPISACEDDGLRQIAAGWTPRSLGIVPQFN